MIEIIIIAIVLIVSLISFITFSIFYIKSVIKRNKEMTREKKFKKLIKREIEASFFQSYFFERFLQKLPFITFAIIFIILVNHFFIQDLYNGIEEIKQQPANTTAIANDVWNNNNQTSTGDVVIDIVKVFPSWVWILIALMPIWMLWKTLNRSILDTF